MSCRIDRIMVSWTPLPTAIFNRSETDLVILTVREPDVQSTDIRALSAHIWYQIVSDGAAPSEPEPHEGEQFVQYLRFLSVTICNLESLVWPHGCVWDIIGTYMVYFE